MSDTTTFEDKCNILADMWVSYNKTGKFQDFFDYNDLGLPLAYAIANNLVTPNEKTATFINETFDILLELFQVEDTGFGELDEIVGLSEY